jgi:hypothetical protein
MDNDAIKSPGSVTFVKVESNAVDEKQLPFGGTAAVSNSCKRSGRSARR